MKKEFKTFEFFMAGLIGLLILIFALGVISLGYYKFFGPKTENVKREIFENTKSYVEGVQQDLGKYYLEYQQTDEKGKAAIRATIQMRFAEVDPNKLQSPQLRRFLVRMRGY